MKKIFLSALLLVASLPIFAQLNVQLHYDFGDAFYGNKLSNRPHLTATVENFKADKWGSTYFFVDLDFGGNTMKSAYAEFSRELRFWEAPIAFHVEYNGGLSGFGSYFASRRQAKADLEKLQKQHELDIEKEREMFAMQKERMELEHRHQLELKQK